ncbi:hypothetical protein [Trichormus variabilis]|uniref:Uncharacterized protein n=1 Tax=Trichormus variabilis SAG 1403-4b TaxID=447716 RepID=A0A3S1BX95_ANAVA|nr:hypothetical protein [Trichormus variabilis]MBD2629629.1 hypothetical protein [Trichormus variabilis FACHB-164]RUS92952.1 hypothetical protein DSM107003_46990 [Trichormus variabilis SAG 1403-4b]
MPKILECDRCLFYSHNPHLICAVYPSGVEGNNCLDFREDPNAETEELWQPDGATYYNEELIFQPPMLTPEQQIEILNTHPMFTGFCPQCGAEFERDYISRVHWDCSECGWKDDSI